MVQKTRSPLLRYGVALLATAISLVATLLFQPLIAPFHLFFASVLISVWYGRRGPGILAVLLAALAVDFLMLPPLYSIGIHDREHQLRLALFALVSVLIISIVEALHEARKRAEESAEEARRHREALRASHEQISEILSSITDCFYALDRQRRFTNVNPQAEAYLGRRREELVGRPIAEVYPQFTGSIVDAQYQKALAEQVPVHFEMRSLVFDRWAEIHAYPSLGGLAVYFRDITERKRLEEELRQRAEELAEADRRKDEFLAMLAHELRNPLAPIVNAVELLKRLVPREHRLIEAQQIIGRQVRTLVRLTDDLLDVSRITHERITLQRETLDLVQLVRDTAEDRRYFLEAAGLTLTLELPEDPMWLVGDATRLAQVVGNLLNNAAKFTEPGGRVTVRLEGAAGPRRLASAVSSEEGETAPVAFPELHPGGAVDCAVLVVQDTGIGIEPEMLPRVFETFAQGDRSLDRSRRGLGLGLALVKGLVELHGGEVQVSSDGAGRGSEFRVLLPITAAPGASPQEPPPAVAPARPLRILIVEDNRDATEPLRYLLQLRGDTVEVAHSGPEGVEAARRFRPEVVLCDIGLPGMDGYAVAAALRQDAATAAARLIALSGYGQEEHRRRSREAGFDLYLTKPIPFVELERFLAVTSHNGEAGP